MGSDNIDCLWIDMHWNSLLLYIDWRFGRAIGAQCFGFCYWLLMGRPVFCCSRPAFDDMRAFQSSQRTRRIHEF